MKKDPTNAMTLSRDERTELAQKLIKAVCTAIEITMPKEIAESKWGGIIILDAVSNLLFITAETLNMPVLGIVAAVQKATDVTYDTTDSCEE